MAKKLRICLFTLVALVLLATLNLNRVDPPLLLIVSKPDPNLSTLEHEPPIAIRHIATTNNLITTTSILLPDWEVLTVSPTPLPRATNYTCKFGDELESVGNLVKDTAVRCELPRKLRRRAPFPQPVIVNDGKEVGVLGVGKQLLRWDWLVYDSVTTEEDVIVFAKGINRRQGSYRDPSEFRCVFGDDNAIKTVLTSSVQEVFRCKLPAANAIISPVKVSLEISSQGIVVPSVAQYKPLLKMAENPKKSLLCASTMVYNSAKFLKEWVVYHSSIGVEKFILYDNNSDDDLHVVVEELEQLGYDITTLLWIWPKTQEAGFSHSATYAKDKCTWLMFTDVDEFVYSPSWKNSSNVSSQMLQSLLPEPDTEAIGQIMIDCLEFGPSGQKSNPTTGVTQGYNCRRKIENRHKSIVLLDAIDESLLNVIHHFKLREGYRNMKLGKDEAVVNHYKYQAWTEFRNKFRRRVSAYVADWTKAVNPASKDRAPGLGYEAVEPEGWTGRFCEVRDNRLKDLTRKWFSDGDRMAWQRDQSRAIE